MSSALEKRWFAAVGSIEHCVLCGVFGCQVSHSNQERGMRQKSAPCHTAAICPKGHDEIDNGKELSQDQRRALHWRAVGLTHEALLKSGYLLLVPAKETALALRLQELEELREVLINIGRQLIAGNEIPVEAWDEWTKAQAADAAQGHPWKGWQA